MRLMISACVMWIAFQLSGCSSSSKDGQSDMVGRPTQDRLVNPDLLSTDGELFPLSAFFGVCVRYKGVWDAELRSGPSGPHYPTGGYITVEGSMKLKISVGKFGMLPGAVLKDIPATSQPRRIQIGHDRVDTFVLVSNFENAGNNSVSIEYDGKDADAASAAIRFANNVVACHVSAVPSKVNGDDR